MSDEPARCTVSGEPWDESKRELQPNGQQKDYVILCAEERAKGFVRPVRRSYVHVGIDPVMHGAILVTPGRRGCGARTTMGVALAETYARDPKFYDATFCVRCGSHRSVGADGEFVWEGTTERVGT